MRICVVLNASWNIVNFRLGLMNALRSEGHEVIAIAPRDAYSDRIPFPYLELPMKPDGTNPIEEIRLFANFIRLYRKARPDLVLQFTPKPNLYGSTAARLLGIPCMSNIAGLGTLFTRPGWRKRIFEKAFSWALRKNSQVFFQNKDDQGYFLERGIVMPSQAKRVPGSGVNLAHFAPGEGGRTEGPIRFLLLSRLLWEKGVGDFVEASRMLKSMRVEAECRLLGFLDARNPGAIPRAVVEQWQSEGVVRYLGTSDDVRTHIAEADCIVLPSTYREGVPRALLEAAAMAKPIIAYENVGTRELVEDGKNGFLVAPKDVPALAAAMARIAGMRDEERLALGRAGRRKVSEEYDEALVIDSYREAIRELRVAHA